MQLLHRIAVLATVLSTVSAFSLRSPYEGFEDHSASRRSQRRATGFQSGGGPLRSRLRARGTTQQREYVRPRRTIQTTSKSFLDQDLYAIESPIFNAPLPVSNNEGFRQRRHDTIPQANIIQLNPTYRQQGIQQITVRNPFDEPQGTVYNPPTFRPQMSAAEKEVYIQRMEPVMHHKTEAPSLYRLTGVRAKGPRPTVSFAQSEDARFVQPQGNGNLGNIKMIQEVPGTKLVIDDSAPDIDYYHPNHRYREKVGIERKPHAAALQTQRNVVYEPQTDERQQRRTQIPEPAIEDFQSKQEEELLYYKQQQQLRRQKEEQLKGLLNQYEEQEPVEVRPKNPAPYFEEENVEEERRVIPVNPRVLQAAKTVREDRLPTRHEQYQDSRKEPPFSQVQIPERQERIPERQERIPDRQERIPERQERIPDRQERNSARHEPLPVRHQQRPARHESQESLPSRREPSPARHEPLPPRNERIPVTQERPIITLKPVYPKNYKPEQAVKQPSERPDYEREPVNFLPEYRQSFKDSSSASKEKRQAHHGDGGYIDHNGVEFAAAASAAEAAHGHGGDGRLTFQLHGQKGPHSYRFGFDTGKGPHRQFRYEERDNDGAVKGRYGYYDSHGKLQMYNYSAHPEHGYSAAEAH